MTIGLLLDNGPGKCHHFVIHFAGNRVCGKFFFSSSQYSHCKDKMISALAKITQSKSYSNKREKLLLTINLARQCENASRLGVLNHHDPGPCIHIVQSDHLVSSLFT